MFYLDYSYIKFTSFSRKSILSLQGFIRSSRLAFLMDRPIVQMLKVGDAPIHQECRLAEMAEANGTLGGYIAAWHLSDDVISKNTYVRKVAEATRQNPTRMDYSRAYMFCSNAGNEELAEQLWGEMREKYPFYTLFHSMPLKLMASARY